MTHDDQYWRRVASNQLLDRPPWFSVHQDSVTLPNGNRIDDYHRIDMPSSAVVVLIDTKSRVLVLEQYRYGVDAYCLNLPGGRIDPGELPEAAAKRELLEETGYQAEEWSKIGQYSIHASYGCGSDHLFIAGKPHSVGAPTAQDIEGGHAVWMDADVIAARIGSGERMTLTAFAGLTRFLLEVSARAV